MKIFDIQKVQVFLLSAILKVIYRLNRKSVKGRKNYVTNTQDQIKRDRKFFESEISKIYDKIEKQKG